MSVDIHTPTTAGPTLDNLLVIRLTGKLATADYEQFVPVLERHIREHGTIRLLLELHDFHGWTAGALWEDTRFDIHHYSDIDRLAIVGERRWEKGLAIFAKPFTAAEVRYFDHGERDAAEKWLRAE